jgi:hypothetical protein
MALKWPFDRHKSKQLGNGFSLAEIKDFATNFNHEVKASSTKQKNSLASKFLVDGEVRKGEFFGIERINELLELAEKSGRGVSGLRIYYGLAYENFKEMTEESEISNVPIKNAKDAELRPRLFLVAVDEDGKDIEIDHTGFKDTPDGNGLGNGSPQPPYGK